ncbi:unnamed protein product, partial [Mesorhabditis belari]
NDENHKIDDSPPARIPELITIKEELCSPQPLSSCPTPEDLPELPTIQQSVSVTNALAQPIPAGSALFTLNQMLQNSQSISFTSLNLPSTSSLLFHDLPVFSASLNSLETPKLHLDLTRTTELLGTSYALGLNFVECLKKNLGSAKSYASALLALETTSFAQSSWITPRENPILNELETRIQLEANPRPQTATSSVTTSPTIPLLQASPSTSSPPLSSSQDALHSDLGLNFINLDVTLRNALIDPLLLCQRIPMTWDSLQTAPDINTAFRYIYCRQTVHYIDWLSSLGDVHLLDQRDKLMLISAGLSHVQLLMMFYHTYRTGSSGIAYSLGYHYSIKGQGAGTEFENFLDALAKYGHDMTITLYSCSMRLTDSGMEVVRRARQKHEQILVEYMKEEYSGWTDEQRSVRVHSILALKNYLRNMALMDNSYLGRMVALNQCQMRCQIAYDVHLKEF